MFYDKQIKYLDVYENGEKVHNAGFVRLEAREDKANIQVRAEKLRQTDTGSLQVILRGGEKEAVLGELMLEKGRGVLECRGLKVTALAGEIGYEELEEMYLKLPGERMLRCIIRERQAVAEPEEQSFEESGILLNREIVQPAEEEVGLEAAMISEDELMSEPISGGRPMPKPEPMPEPGVMPRPEPMPEPGVMPRPEPLLFPEASRRPGGMSQPGPVLRPLSMPPQQSQAERPYATTKWQQLSDVYPHIRPFGDGRDYLQLRPADLVVLAQKYYPLISNSFLLHGFYNYEHLILAREKRQDGEHFYVGVPGNFYEKEKQVAVLFGFESFEGKAEPAKNGEFGYYMISVEI